MDSYNKFPSIFSEFYAACKDFEFPFKGYKDLHSYGVLKLTGHEKEMLKMLVWFDMYIYLSDTLTITYKEDNMFNPTLIRTLLIELIKDNEYTLEGIEYATRVPLGVLEDIIYEINLNPSVVVAVTIIEYYIVVKRQDYTEFLRKILQWAKYYYK